MADNIQDLPVSEPTDSTMAPSSASDEAVPAAHEAEAQDEEQTLPVRQLPQTQQEREAYLDALRRQAAADQQHRSALPSNTLGSGLPGAEAPDEPQTTSLDRADQQAQIDADAAFARQLDDQYNQEAIQGPAPRTGMYDGKPYADDTTHGWTKAARERLAKLEREHPEEVIRDSKDRERKVQETAIAYEIRQADAKAWRDLPKPKQDAVLEEKQEAIQAASRETEDEEKWFKDVDQRLALERDVKAARDLDDELKRAEKTKKSGKSDAEMWQDFADSEDEEDEFDDEEADDEASSSDDSTGGVPLP